MTKQVDMLAMVQFTPLMLAALLCWILCVCVHEFCHAVVAYWGGDKSVRGKGYLSLDPTKFIDPVGSLLLPAIMLLLGGLPLPGGAVMIDERALKSPKWSQFVSAAGPAGNLILFLLFALPLHPKLGIVEPFAEEQPTWVYFCGAMATLNFLGALFNLIPVPPLDGYRLIEHKLPQEIQFALRQPQATYATFALLLLLFWSFDWPMKLMIDMLVRVCGVLGLPDYMLASGFMFVLFDS